jgi:hypothetical protein
LARLDMRENVGVLLSECLFPAAECEQEVHCSDGDVNDRLPVGKPARPCVLVVLLPAELPLSTL